MCSRHLKVRVENRGELTAGSFCGGKELDKDKLLCDMDVALPTSRSDPDISVVKIYYC